MGIPNEFEGITMKKVIDTLPDSSSEFRSLVHALYGVWITPLESSRTPESDDEYTVAVSGYADEYEGDYFIKYRGYSFTLSAHGAGATNSEGESLFEFEGAKPELDYRFDKTVRSHAEVKNELDRLWVVLNDPNERYALRRVYEFLQEGYPTD